MTDKMPVRWTSTKEGGGTVAALRHSALSSQPATRAAKSDSSCIPSIPKSTLPFPNELISRVLSYSSQGTLASICRVSKAMYRIASPVLWKHLVLSPWKVNQDEERVLDEKEADCGSMKTRQKNGKALRNDVVTFSVYHHSPTWCRSNGRSTLKLPNVHTLHLHLRDYRLHYGYDKRGCRLLRDVAPKMIVLHNACTHLMEPESFDLPSELFKATEELVCMSLVSTALSPTVFGDMCLEKMFNLKKMIWIFQPVTFDPSRNYRSTSRYFDGHDYQNELAQIAIDLWKTRLVIVNAGIIQFDEKDCRKTTIEESQRQNERFVKKEVEEYMMYVLHWSSERIKERIESIEFMDLDEFMEKEEWWKYMNAEELEEWKIMTDHVEKRFVVEAETDPADGKEVMDE